MRGHLLPVLRQCQLKHLLIQTLLIAHLIWTCFIHANKWIVKQGGRTFISCYRVWVVLWGRSGGRQQWAGGCLFYQYCNKHNNWVHVAMSTHHSCLNMFCTRTKYLPRASTELSCSQNSKRKIFLNKSMWLLKLYGHYHWRIVSKISGWFVLMGAQVILTSGCCCFFVLFLFFCFFVCLLLFFAVLVNSKIQL